MNEVREFSIDRAGRVIISKFSLLAISIVIAIVATREAERQAGLYSRISL